MTELPPIAGSGYTAPVSGSQQSVAATGRPTTLQPTLSASPGKAVTDETTKKKINEALSKILGGPVPDRILQILAGFIKEGPS